MKMTNAEKLAKDTNAMEYLIETMCDSRPSCINCPVKRVKCMEGMQIREWLEAEEKEDD